MRLQSYTPTQYTYSDALLPPRINTIIIIPVRTRTCTTGTGGGTYAHSRATTDKQESRIPVPVFRQTSDSALSAIISA